MQAQPDQAHVWWTNLIPFVAIAVVLAVRTRRMAKVRLLRLERLWVVPVLYLAVVAMLYIQHPPTPSGWGFALIGLLAGCALGWQRGKTTRIIIEPETHRLNQQTSILGMAFLAVLVVSRQVAAIVGAEWHFDVGAIIDTLAAVALGMFTVQRIEIYVRAKRLLVEAQAVRRKS